MLRWMLFVLAAAVAAAAPWAWSKTGRSVLNAVAGNTSTRAQAAAARVKPQLEADLRSQGLRFGAPVFLRIFKQEAELELWMAGKDGSYQLFRTYPICRYSGQLGPKTRQGDNQAPEGFYTVGLGQLNPASSYHLSFNLGYPNAYERALGYTGDYLMVHGSCVSIGCYAMGDAAIEQIYTLAEAALRGGQKAFHVHAFPFRLDDAALAAQRGSAWFDFWSDLKPGYDAFERVRQPPRVSVRERRYRIDRGQE